MIYFVVLHKEAIEVLPPVLACISSWYRHRGGDVELLTPDRRFERGHVVLGAGEIVMTYVCQIIVPEPWYGLQPGGDRRSLDELQQARQKIHKSLHIFVCPHLLCTGWHRTLYRSA